MVIGRGHARRTTLTAVRGHIEAWPNGILDALPTQDWLAVLAPPRQDKILTSILRHRRMPGLIFYEERTRTYPQKGTVVSLVPMIGSWVFVHGCHPEDIWQTERAIRILPIRQEAEFARDLTDFIALVRFNGTKPVVRPHLVPGIRVQVESGPMAGLHGIIVRRRGHARLVVNLTAMGTCIESELPAEIVDEEKPPVAAGSEAPAAESEGAGDLP